MSGVRTRSPEPAFGRVVRQTNTAIVQGTGEGFPPLKQVWIIAWPAHRFGVHAGKPGSLQIEAVDERFDEAHWVVRSDIIINRLRQEQKL